MKKLIFLIGFASLLLASCTTNNVELFVVNGDAMEPTFQEGEYLLVDASIEEFVLDDVVVYTNEKGHILVGRISSINEEYYEISPDNMEIEVNRDEYLPARAEDIIGTASLCSKGRFKCWLQTFLFRSW